VAEGVSGMFVEQPEVESIATALRRFLAREVRFDARACRAFAQRFRWQHIVDAVLPHYAG
jgi:hypothetical protein